MRRESESTKGSAQRPATSRRGQRGVAAIEFALILPFLTVLILALVDYGYYFYIGVNATEAARATAMQIDTTVAAMNSGTGVASCSDSAIPTVVQASTAQPNLTAQAYMTNTVNATIGTSTAATITCTPVSSATVPNQPAWSTVITVTFAPPSGTVHFGLPRSGSNLVYTTKALWRR
jgi:Flp pilus assembly protein TadG